MIRSTPVLLLTLVALSACGKPLWRSPLPTLSDLPLAPGQPVDAGIYPLVLPDTTEYPLLLAESTLVVVPGGGHAPILDPGDSYLVARRWPDSVKAGFAAAFADYNQRGRQPHPVSPLALVDPQVRFGRPGAMECNEQTPECVTMACTDARTRECAPTSTWVWLSPVGFNADSTYAVVYVRTWCGGGLCADGTVFLFCRQPGKQWTLWSVRRLWIA